MTEEELHRLKVDLIIARDSLKKTLKLLNNAEKTIDEQARTINDLQNQIGLDLQDPHWKHSRGFETPPTIEEIHAEDSD